MAKMLSNKNRAIHVSAFMSRFPGLLNFLVERLKSLLREQRKNHMSMMPLLLLMSKLVPDSDKIVIEQRVPLLNMLTVLETAPLGHGGAEGISADHVDLLIANGADPP